MISHVVTEIQSLGVRLGKGLLRRQGGAGPADAGAFLIDGIAVTVPTGSPYVSASPYSLRAGEGRVFLCKDGRDLLPVEMIPRPRFYEQTTGDGTPCKKIALLHGKDCLATSVLQTCIYWDTDRQCRFCGIELSLKSRQTILLKTPEQLAETARLTGPGWGQACGPHHGNSEAPGGRDIHPGCCMLGHQEGCGPPGSCPVSSPR